MIKGGGSVACCKGNGIRDVWLDEGGSRGLNWMEREQKCLVGWKEFKDICLD